MTQASMNDIKQQIELICIERGLDIDEVMKAIESSIASAYRKEFGDKDMFYTAEYDMEHGTYSVYEIVEIVDEVLQPGRELSIVEALLSNPNARVGDVIKTKQAIDQSINFGYIASQVAKQVLTQNINNIRHSKIVQRFKDKIGDLVTVEVDGFRKGGYIVKIDQTTGFINKEHVLPIDKFRPGQIIKALIVDITEDDRGNSRIVFSRTHPDFIRALLNQEVPEIASGVVQIERIVREPGSRTKVLVYSHEDEQNVDPVGTILGRKNVRLISIMREISTSMQEKIDIVEYRPDELEEMIADSLEPAQIEKVEIIDDAHADVYCYQEEASLAVGKWGSNIRLAGRLFDMELTLNVINEENPLEVGIVA